MSTTLNVALINVVLDGDYQYEQEIPLGLASIGAFLRSQGHPVQFHQWFASRCGQQFLQVSQIDADVYGFQLTMVNYLQVRRVVNQIKKVNPDAVTVFGGPFLVSLSEDILKNEPSFDFTIIGEGEFTLLELLQKLPDHSDEFGDIQGLVWRNTTGDVIKNPVRRPLDNLDALPFPARDFLDEAQTDPVDGGLSESVRMISSRGCVGKCSFCCVNLYSKVQKSKRWRGRSPEHVVDELEYLIKDYNAKIFNFSDSSFEDPGEAGKRRAKAICEEIIRRNLSLSAKVYMRCETMKTDADIELLKAYKKAGIDIIIVGAEAGSDYELKLYEKHASVEDNYRTAKLLRELAIFYVLVGFIMFGPYSTPETLLANVEYLHQCHFTDNVMQLANMLMLVRDSKIYSRLKEEGRVIESENYWEQPKYIIVDPIGDRMAHHWQNLYYRFPATKEITSQQMNIGNLIARMTNPMNEKILNAFREEFKEFKTEVHQLNTKFGDLNYEYFKESLYLIQKDCSDETLQKSAYQFFDGLYKPYIPIYLNLYNGFIDKVMGAGFGLSGLVFKSFFSTLAIDGTKRIASKRAGAPSLQFTHTQLQKKRQSIIAVPNQIP